MKKNFTVIIFLFYSMLSAQNVVINEVLYDPVGPDTGYEWIELYNNSDSAVNLHNWMIEKAGTSFTLVFVFPPINIQPHSFLLIGEANVPDTDLTATLAFQNGGDETDGIRLVSHDGSYTDTVLYDSPNTNNLPDDVSSPAIYFAPDVAAGNTLARKVDGEDTNNCQLDFFECLDPTPGYSNFYPIDLAIYELEIILESGQYWLQTEIFNLSTENVDNSEASLEITINEVSYTILELPALPPESSVPFYCLLGSFSTDYVIIEAELIYQYDNQLENNFVTVSILIDQSPLVINEIFFKPQSPNQEWIEIYNRSSCGYLVDNFEIVDAAGGKIYISGYLEANDFLVVCQDSLFMIQTYPDLHSDKIITSSSWTALNNVFETLVLTDEYSTIFDSLEYNGSSCPYNYSIERVNPFDDENIQWLVCEDSAGATPTLPNSVLPLEKDLELNVIGLWQENETVCHKLELKNIGLENIVEADLYCFSYRYEDDDLSEIYFSSLTLVESLEVTFNTPLPASGYYRYDYEITASEDINQLNNNGNAFFNMSALPFVINEIMYAPATGLPEWIEIKQNFLVPELQHFYLIAEQDTLFLPFFQEEYILITSNYAAADTLQKLYDLTGIEILLGLPNLSNNGEQLTLLDGCGNLIESFFYLPAWNLNQNNVSLERVNSYIPANESNWGPSVAGCTPGKENSIYVQILPPQLKLSVEPNPFSPFRGEHTVFGFKLPEVISKVTLRIFDLKGRMLCKLINQQLQASTGNIVWDGRDADGKNLLVGVYVVLMEATAFESEKVYAKKITVVIGK